MFAAHLYIEKYDWDVTIYVDVAPKDTNEIMRALYDNDCSTENMRKAGYMLVRGALNEGFTQTARGGKHTIIVVGKVSSLGEFFNTFSHERLHLISHIADHYDIDMHSEEAAYLYGDVTEMLYHGLVRIVKRIYDNLARFISD